MHPSQIEEIEAHELAGWLDAQAGKLRVIDVRQPGEFAAGTVPGALGLPLHTLPFRVSEFARDDKLVFVCHSGARSAQACMFLKHQGYRNVLNLRGGMIAWTRSGRPLGVPQAD